MLARRLFSVLLNMFFAKFVLSYIVWSQVFLFEAGKDILEPTRLYRTGLSEILRIREQFRY